MCYSAQLQMRFKSVKEMLKAEADYAAFQQIMEARLTDDSIKIPKALEANFYSAKTPVEKRILDAIRQYQDNKTKELEAELFKQQKRLADAERKLKVKETKKSLEDRRIASTKIKWHLKKIADLKRTEHKDSDSRIFPYYYAPVVIQEGREMLIRPMRYQCRPAGKPASIDDSLTLYNARRDNLDKFWKRQFEQTRGLVIVQSFYENVALHDFEHREKGTDEAVKTLVIHFNPKPAHDMLVACLWSHWEKPGQVALDSFAAITDEPPPEVAAAGHDRCIVPIEAKNVSTWLSREPEEAAKLYSVLDERDRPYYRHQLAA